MTEPESGVMVLNVDSNIASGVAAVLFDVLLLAIIKVQAQSLCSTANVFLVYDKRQPIKPTQSRLGCLAGGPVGPRRLARIFSILIAIVTGCVILLGFSINGKTVQAYEPQKYQTLVAVTFRPAKIDFGNEVEVHGDGNFSISQHLVSMADAWVCLRNYYGHSKVFAYAFKNLRLDKTKMEGKVRDQQVKKYKGGECVSRPEFRDEIISRQYGLDGHGSPVLCPMTIPNVELKEQDDGRKYGSVEIETTDECKIKLRSFYCFELGGQTSCAGMGFGDTDKDPTANASQGYMVLVGDKKNDEFFRYPEITEVEKAYSLEDEKEIGLNVAFLATLGFGGGVSNIANMAITEVSHDVVLHRSIGERQISEVDLRMAKPLVWFVVSLTVVLLLAVVILWVIVIYSKGRTNYNSFSTVSEVLQLASSNRMQKTRQAYEDQPYVGILTSDPKIVVLGRDDRGDITDARWTEPEIGGPTGEDGRHRGHADDYFDSFAENSFCHYDNYNNYNRA